MKITKAEWDRFWALLGDAWYMDGSDQDPDDDSGLAPSDMITITYGALGYQGDRHAEPSGIPGVFSASQARDAMEEGCDLLAAFRRWRKSQNVITFAVECPKDKADTLRELIRNNGGKVL